VRAAIACVSLALVVTACGREAEGIPYSLRVTSASEPRLPQEDYYHGDARRDLPQILEACGIHEFRLLQGEAGEVAFGFDIPADRKSEISSCIQTRSPKGTYLHPVYTL
jgi:hypothetical protein